MKEIIVWFPSFAHALLCNWYDSQSMQEEAKIPENGVIVEFLK